MSGDGYTRRSSELAQIRNVKTKLQISTKDFRAILAETTGYDTIGLLDEQGLQEVLTHLKALEASMT